jgi:hypothetical protein
MLHAHARQFALEPVGNLGGLIFERMAFLDKP